MISNEDVDGRGEFLADTDNSEEGLGLCVDWSVVDGLSDVVVGLGLALATDDCCWGGGGAALFLDDLMLDKESLDPWDDLLTVRDDFDKLCFSSSSFCTASFLSSALSWLLWLSLDSALLTSSDTAADPRLTVLT